MSAARGYGYRQDVHDASRDPRVGSLFGADIVYPSFHSMEQWIDYPRDQLKTNECVAFSLARCFHVRSRALGQPIDWPSTPSIYFWARDKERQANGLGESSPLVDDGCIPAYAVQGCVDHGVPRDQDWPFSEAGADDEPTQQEVKLASAFRVDGFRRVYSTGAQRLAEIRQAIGNDYPVMICKQVDRAFEDYTSGVVTASDPKNLVGGHATVLFAYDSSNRFRGVNSWGRTSWGVNVTGSTSGDLGFYVADDAFVADACVADIYVVVGYPTVWSLR